jgi:hypothetical protein
MLFRGIMSDPLNQQASSWDGAMSNAVGFAAKTVLTKIEIRGG